jgi:osmotically-inducible protein OsmY
MRKKNTLVVAYYDDECYKQAGEFSLPRRRMSYQLIKKGAAIACLGLSCWILSGCVVAAAGVAAATAGSTISDERTVGKIVDDKVIKLKIRDRYNQKDMVKRLYQVSVNVSEGRVMLTGSVPDHASKLQAIKLAWEVEGVREVMNEIETEEKSLGQRAKDSMIATQIRAKYLLREGFRSVNYTVDVNNGTVYLLGIAQNKHELQAAEEMASTANGVNKVVSHVVLKADMRRQK